MDVYINKIDEVFAYVECDDSTAYEINDYFSFWVKGYIHMPKYRAGLWDGKIRLFSRYDRKLYIGLLKELYLFCKARNYKFSMSSDFVSSERINWDIKKLNLPFTPYDYQEDAVSVILNDKRKLILSPTSSGKSLIIYGAIRYFVEQNKHTLLIVPTTNLVNQMVGDFAEYGWVDYDAHCHKIYSGKSKDTDKPVIVSTWQSLQRQPKEYFDKFDAIMVDECFPPDVEVLTDNGYIKFGELTHHEKIAQYDNGEITFVTPLRYVNKMYDGNIITLQSDKLINLPMTENHEQLYYNRKTKTYHKKAISEFNSHSNFMFKGSGIINNGDSYLTSDEKLAIMTQADGYITPQNNIQVQFSKSRKINAFLDLMAEGGFRYDEVKSKSYGNQKQRSRFIIKDVYHITKDIRNHISLGELSYNKAVEIIDYMVIWDGCISKRTGNYYYSNTNESQVDFYQAVSSICGYKTNKTIQVDHRSDKFNDVYRLFITLDTDQYGTNRIKKLSSSYKGMVHCVTVPSGNIIVRHDGFVTVTGNCHLASAASIKGIMERTVNATYRIGLTGTIEDTKTHKMVLTGLFGDIYSTIQTHELMERDLIAKLSIDSLVLKYSDEECQLVSQMSYDQEINHIISNSKRNKFICNLALSTNGNTLVLFNFIERHGIPLFEMMQALNKKGKRIFFVHGDTSADTREEIRQYAEEHDNVVIVASFGVFSTGVSVKNLDTLIFAHPYKAKIKILQSIGRVLRKAHFEATANLIDIVDDLTYGKKLNFAIKHAKERMKIYVKSKFKVIISRIEI